MLLHELSFICETRLFYFIGALSLEMKKRSFMRLTHKKAYDNTSFKGSISHTLSYSVTACVSPIKRQVFWLGFFPQIVFLPIWNPDLVLYSGIYQLIRKSHTAAGPHRFSTCFPIIPCTGCAGAPFHIGL